MEVFEGEIVHGSKRAAALGYPTVNVIAATRGITGIYAADVEIGDALYRAAAYADPARGIIEAHCFGLAEDVYGKHARITLVRKIRESAVFTDEHDLKVAIASDIEAVRAYFGDL